MAWLNAEYPSPDYSGKFVKEFSPKRPDYLRDLTGKVPSNAPSDGNTNPKEYHGITLLIDHEDTEQLFFCASKKFTSKPTDRQIKDSFNCRSFDETKPNMQLSGKFFVV